MQSVAIFSGCAYQKRTLYVDVKVLSVQYCCTIDTTHTLGRHWIHQLTEPQMSQDVIAEVNSANSSELRVLCSCRLVLFTLQNVHVIRCPRLKPYSVILLTYTQSSDALSGCCLPCVWSYLWLCIAPHEGIMLLVKLRAKLACPCATNNHFLDAPLLTAQLPTMLLDSYVWQQEQNNFT
jgi:hypothetical protein